MSFRPCLDGTFGAVVLQRFFRCLSRTGCGFNFPKFGSRKLFAHNPFHFIRARQSLKTRCSPLKASSLAVLAPSRAKTVMAASSRSVGSFFCVIFSRKTDLNERLLGDGQLQPSQKNGIGRVRCDVLFKTGEGYRSAARGKLGDRLGRGSATMKNRGGRHGPAAARIRIQAKEAQICGIDCFAARTSCRP